MTREEIIEGILETMENCAADCTCGDCPIREYCNEWEKIIKNS